MIDPHGPDRADPAARAAWLRTTLARHGHAYYVLDNPTIPDADYDLLYRELEQIEAADPRLATDDSPTRRVGAAPLGQFAPVRHSVPMLSLGNGFEDADIVAFDRRVSEGLQVALSKGVGGEPNASMSEPESESAGKSIGNADVEYAAELKFDGLAINLRYENGLLVEAATRGDGTTGEVEGWRPQGLRPQSPPPERRPGERTTG